MKLHFKVLLMVCFFSLLIVSCDKNEAVDDANNQKELVKKRLFKAAKTAASKGSTTPSTSDEDFDSECIATFDCFEYVFPITLTNGTKETAVNNNDELYGYYASLDENADPKIKFPIKIKDSEGNEKTINNDEELDQAYNDCFEDGNDDVCFTINFPVTVIGEGTALVLNEMEVNSETELHAFIEKTYEEDDTAKITFKYPITVKLTDGTEKTVNNDEEFDALYADCYGFEDYNDFEGFTCFEIQFPITAKANGEDVTLNSLEDIDNYLAGLGDDEDPEFVFPIDIAYADGTNVTLNNIEEVETAFDECFYNGEESDICFDITYPINLVKNEEATNVITVNSDEEFDNFLDGLTEDDYIDIAYPLTVILDDEDNTKKVINNDEGFIALVDSCAVANTES